MARTKLQAEDFTPKRKTNNVRKKQFQLRQMLSNPKAFLRRYMGGKKKVVKKKAGKQLQAINRALFGQQRGGNQNIYVNKKRQYLNLQHGGNLSTQRKPVNKLPTIYQYYQ
ncbi:Hypothetical predicted protein [Paramuricea clavata]|uniref:Uncharacterized protein n=1 Tax=Paramuricea clavata TaxID=317549 RepID=A0A6S7FIT6_PARCT|nr:Hypothetical predicted protein [Paramuricea clavata]